MSDTTINIQRFRVRSHQTDLNAAMYHGAYLDVFDYARIETFRRIGYTYADVVREGWNPMIRRVECEYRAAARMDDELDITVKVPRLTSATMLIRYECRRGDRLLAVAHVTFVFVDRTGRPIRVPSGLRQVVRDHAEVLELEAD